MSRSSAAGRAHPCARAASRGSGVRLGMLFDGFRLGLRPQLVLGAVYLVAYASHMLKKKPADA